MIITKYGKVVKGLGGLYNVRVNEGDGKISIYTCRAKGVLHKDEEKLLVGDNVSISIDDTTPDGIIISEIKERKNELIRPPMANLDYLFMVFAAKKPSPVLEVVDKLIAIAVHNDIKPVVVVTKKDLDGDVAKNTTTTQKLESGNDIVWQLMNGKPKIEITEPERAIKALDKAKDNSEYNSLYWIIYKMVNGNG